MVKSAVVYGFVVDKQKLAKKGKLENKYFIRHLPDNYANAPRGLFGTFKMNDIVKKDLKKFTPSNSFDRLIKRLRYMTYHILRISLIRNMKILNGGAKMVYSLN